MVVFVVILLCVLLAVGGSFYTAFKSAMENANIGNA